MHTYENIATAVLQNSELSKSLNQMVIFHREYLNLVCPEWKSRLDESDIVKLYHANEQNFFNTCGQMSKRFLNVNKIKSSKHVFKLIIVGKFQYYRDVQKDMHYLVSSSNECLNYINYLLNKDLDESYNRDQLVRFLIDRCNFYSCSSCRKTITFWRTKGAVVTNEANICCNNCKFYDGSQVRNVPASLFLPNQSTFIGIVSVIIDSRYTCTDKHNGSLVRLAGKINSCIMFKESSIEPVQELYFGDEDSEKTDEPIIFSTTNDEEGFKNMFGPNEEDKVSDESNDVEEAIPLNVKKLKTEYDVNTTMKNII